MQLPKYRSHKIVEAVKIRDVRFFADGTITIVPDTSQVPYLPSFSVGKDWGDRFKGRPDDPGYYIRYEDGYESWSPSKAFEEGYIRVG